MRLSATDRLSTFLSRQATPAWGRHYQPAIRATRAEAPPSSRPTRMWSSLIGRDLQLLSEPEVGAALLALFHPDLVDLHEQKILSPVQVANPLATHHLASGMSLKPMRGTVMVAAQLGELASHQKVFVADENAPGRGDWTPIPYVGDLFLVFRIRAGIAGINWDIKATDSGYDHHFSATFGGPKRRRKSGDLRHRLEALYYLDGEIPTYRVTLEKLDRSLLANLRDLYGTAQTKSNLTEFELTTVHTALQAALGGTRTVIEVLRSLQEVHAIPVEQSRAEFRRMVWRRELRPDLFKPLLIDRPLARESRDPLEVYRQLFNPTA